MSKIKSLVLAEFLKHFADKKPDPYIWIFSSTDNRHYNYNSRYLFEYVKDNLPHRDLSSMIRSFARSSPPNTAASTLSRLKAHPGSDMF